MMEKTTEIMTLLGHAKALAKAYYALTGKPLGVTGEVAEAEAARLLGLQLADARCEGYDATEIIDGREHKIQIKGRRLLPTSKASQKVGTLKFGKKWDSVMLVLLNEDYEPTSIWQANRAAAETERDRRNRNELTVHFFKKHARLRWTAPIIAR